MWKTPLLKDSHAWDIAHILLTSSMQVLFVQVEMNLPCCQIQIVYNQLVKLTHRSAAR